MTELAITTIRGRSLTEKQRAWLSAYMDCGNASEASRMVGIEKCHAQHGAQVRRSIADFITANLRTMIGRTAPAALETIYELANTCPDPKVRLAAAQDLLNRAGFKETQRIEVGAVDKTDAELSKEIDMLLQRGGIVIGSSMMVEDAEVVE